MAKRISSVRELKQLRRRLQKERPKNAKEILVCGGTGCRANGALAVAKELEKELKKKSRSTGVKVYSKETGCHGFCEKGPLVVIMPKGIFYTKVKTKDVSEIVAKTVVRNEVIDRLLYRDPNTKERITAYTEIPFYKNQTRVSMRSIGKVDPFSLEDSIRFGAYTGLEKIFTGMSPDDVVEEIRISGLRGRGGGGFSTARKWQACRKAEPAVACKVVAPLL